MSLLIPGAFSYVSLPFSFEKCLVRLLAHFLKRGLIKIRNVSQICVVLAERAKLGISCAKSVHFCLFKERNLAFVVEGLSSLYLGQPLMKCFFSLPGSLTASL